MSERQEHKTMFEESLKKLKDLLVSCESIVPWFGKARHILELLNTVSDRLEALRNRTAGTLAQTNIEKLEYFCSLVLLLKLTLLFDVALKLGMTQCTTPIYADSMETVLEAVIQSSFSSEKLQDLADLKLLAVEYGLVDEEKHDGNSQKSEEFLKMLHSMACKLEQMEKLVELATDEPMTFVSIMELKKFTAKIMTVQSQSLNDIPREQIMQEVNNLIWRIALLTRNISFKTESNPSIIYISQYRLLSKRKFERSRLFEVSPRHGFSQISSHLIHHKTRNWLLGKIETWLVTTDKPFYYVIGSEGTGKSCLTSAFCKLYDSYIVNTFVFDSRHPCGLAALIKSIANSLMSNFPEYLCIMDALIPENQSPPCSADASWQDLYKFLLKDPFNMLFGSYKKFPRRKLIVVEALNECNKAEWKDLAYFMELFRKDFSYWLCMLVTCRTECMEPFPFAYERGLEQSQMADGINLDSKTWIGLHLTDLEMFMASCFCDVIARRVNVQELTSGDNFRGFTKSLDNFMRHSTGKFSYAQHLLRLFDESMLECHGQFQKSVISAFEKFTAQIGRDKIDECLRLFSKVFYNYRLNEGNPVQPPPEIFLIMSGKAVALD